MENPLTDADYAELLTCIEGIHRCRRLEGFPTHVLTELKKLVSCSYALYSEIDEPRRRAIQLLDPPQQFEPEVQRWIEGRVQADPQGWWEGLMKDHPALNYFKTTGDGQALKFSDFRSVDQYHQLALYHEALVWSGTEDQLGFCLRMQTGLFIGIAFHRGERSFTERDRMMLNLVRSHVLQAYLRLEELAGNEELQRDLHNALREEGLGVIILNRQREIVHATPNALERLAGYIPIPDGMRKLPEKVARWFFGGGEETGRAEYVLSRGSRRLHLRPGLGGDGRMLILSEENGAEVARRLDRFGLTVRELEVLAWIGEGKANGEIAVILGISVNTVKRHVEQVLAKLGVENRTSAASMLRDHGFSGGRLATAE